MNGGFSEVYGDCIRMLLKTLTINVRVVREAHNLLVVFDSFVSEKAKKTLASNMRSGSCHTCLNALNFFHDNDLGNLGQSPRYSALDLQKKADFCGACVWEPLNMRTYLLHRKNFSNGIGIGPWNVSHSRNDA